jgi:spermidine synthase
VTRDHLRNGDGSAAALAVLTIFVLSGAAGLIYEVVWARQLVLVFGNTTQAVSAILTGFFGGMSVGSVIGGRIADRVRSPLRLYAVLEILLVFVVLATSATFLVIDELYQGAYGTLQQNPKALALVRFGLALLALAPATVLMGATLPTLTRHLTRGQAHLSSAFGRLYAANTIGAILGTLAAGIVLIELFGLSGALRAGALCSAIAGILAFYLSRRRERSPVSERSAPSPAVGTSPAPGRKMLALLVAFASGLTSLGYQILWVRLLSAGTGNSTYVFTGILSVFLTGIAIGAVLFTLVRPRLRDPIGLLAGAQVGVAILVLLGLVGVIGRPPQLEPGVTLETVRALAQSVPLVVLPATVVMGLTFPATAALLGEGTEHAGRESGQLLAANTLGAITGSFLVPFVVIPLLGSPSAIAALAGVNIAIGLGLAAFIVRDHLVRIRVAVVGAVGILALLGSILRPGLITDPTPARVDAMGGTIFQSAEDEIAAVQAGRAGPAGGWRQLWVTGTSMTVLTIDANLMPILPLIARPQAEDALVVAFGMGSSFRTALVAGLETDAVELVPSVPDMFGWFHRDAESVKADPNGEIIIADGRNHLELTDRSYDIIVTDPPPPIESSGAAVISSYEYYLAGRERLTPDGIMMQWVPLHPGSGDLTAHLRTFRAIFPRTVVALGPGGNGVFMLGSSDPITFDESAIRAVIDRPGVLANLNETPDAPVRTTDEWVDLIPQLIWLNGDEIDAYVGRGPKVTDDRPFSEYFILRRLFGLGS